MTKDLSQIEAKLADFKVNPYSDPHEPETKITYDGHVYEEAKNLSLLILNKFKDYSLFEGIDVKAGCNGILLQCYLHQDYFEISIGHYDNQEYFDFVAEHLDEEVERLEELHYNELLHVLNKR